MILMPASEFRMGMPVFERSVGSETAGWDE